MSAQLVFILLSGLIVLDEYSLYSSAKLTGIAVGMGTCALGVFLVLKKNHVVKAASDIVSYSHEIYQTQNEGDEQRKRLLNLLSTTSSST